MQPPAVVPHRSHERVRGGMGNRIPGWFKIKGASLVFVCVRPAVLFCFLNFSGPHHQQPLTSQTPTPAGKSVVSSRSQIKFSLYWVALVMDWEYGEAGSEAGFERARGGRRWGHRHCRSSS